MKSFKTVLRILITFASALGFLGGWATLAHAGKPVTTNKSRSQQLQALAPLPTLVPIQTFNNESSGNANNNGGFTIIAPSANYNPPQAMMPLFTTNGS